MIAASYSPDVVRQPYYIAPTADRCLGYAYTFAIGRSRPQLISHVFAIARALAHTQESILSQLPEPAPTTILQLLELPLNSGLRPGLHSLAIAKPRPRHASAIM